MACPSGCLNGGGQIKADGDAALHLEKVASHNTDLQVRHLGEPLNIQALMEQICLDFPHWE